MKISIILIITFLFTINSPLGAHQFKTKNDSLNCHINKAYIKTLATDFVPIVISPIHWNNKQWIGAGAVLGTAAFLYSKDKVIADFWQQHRSTALDNADKYFFDPFGKMYYTIPLMGAFYLYGAASHKNKPKRVAMDFVQASLYSGIIVTIVKNIGHRHRPFQTKNHNPYLWDGPLTQDWGHNSFPSGHTIMAFTFASVIATHYQKTVWVPIIAYSLASMEAMARMYADKHWSSDVLIGGAMGYAIGTFVVNRNHYRIKTIPIISGNFTGLSFIYSL